MKLFFKPNGIKVSLFVSFMLLLPAFIYFGGSALYVPPATILFGIALNVFIAPSLVLISPFFWIGLLIFVVWSAIHYLLSCVCYKMISFIPGKKVRKLLATSIVVCLVMLAIFCKIYRVGDVRKTRLLDYILEWHEIYSNK